MKAITFVMSLLLLVALITIGVLGHKLSETEKILVATQDELNSTRNMMRGLEEELSITQSRLNVTEEEVELTERKLRIEESKVKVEDLREFYSLNELKDWLTKNKVNEHGYIEDVYDCDDFAIDLVRDARKDGYEIFVMGADSITAYEYIEVSNANNMLIAKNIGSYINARGFDRLYEEGCLYFYTINGDELWEVYGEGELHDISDATELIIADSIEYSGHAYCVARINGVWYAIEPMTDEVEKIGKEL